MDAVLAVLTTAVDGAIIQRLVLVSSLLLAGLGAARLAPGGRWTSAGAATLMIWNPFVAERLLLGHWALLLAYGAVPWAVSAALDARSARPGAQPRLLCWLALAALTPPGAAVALLTVAPVVLWPGGAAWRRRSAQFVAVCVTANLPWLGPALLHPSGGRGDPVGVDLFAARSDTRLGLLGSLLGLGGIWNTDAVPASRGALPAAVFTVLLVLVGVAGFGIVRAHWGPGADGLLAAALGGLAVACWGAVAPGSLAAVAQAVPAVGLLRDGHRGVVPLAVLTACAVPLGAKRLINCIPLSGLRPLVAGGLILLPLVVLPDLAWGVFGRLTPAQYPPGWSEVRARLSDEPDTADVLSLPWQTFRRHPWNDDRTVLNPLPRFLDRVVVASSDLPVETELGVRRVKGEDERVARIGALLESGQPLSETLPQEGIGWVVVDQNTPGQVDPALLLGAKPAVTTDSLVLYRLAPNDTTPEGRRAAPYAPLVATADAIVLMILLTSLVLNSRRVGRPGTVSPQETKGGSR
jgi:hypothetical protein